MVSHIFFYFYEEMPYPISEAHQAFLLYSFFVSFFKSDHVLPSVAFMSFQSNLPMETLSVIGCAQTGSHQH